MTTIWEEVKDDIKCEIPQNTFSLWINPLTFLEKKDEIYSIYENDHLMDKNNKRNTLSYLNEFYKIIESENSAKRYILDSCR